jgi:hypothetical protein
MIQRPKKKFWVDVGRVFEIPKNCESTFKQFTAFDDFRPKVSLKERIVKITGSRDVRIRIGILM